MFALGFYIKKKKLFFSQQSCKNASNILSKAFVYKYIDAHALFSWQEERCQNTHSGMQDVHCVWCVCMRVVL